MIKKVEIEFGIANASCDSGYEMEDWLTLEITDSDKYSNHIVIQNLVHGIDIVVDRDDMINACMVTKDK